MDIDDKPPVASAHMGESPRDAALVFERVNFHSKIGLSPGSLKVNAAEFVFNPRHVGQPVSIAVDDVKELAWSILARMHMLSVFMKAGGVLRFDGFQIQDADKFSKFAESTANCAFKNLQFATSGKNWGDVQLDDSYLHFLVDKKPAFDIPIQTVTGAQFQPRTQEVAVEFNVEESAALVADSDEQLVELRLYVPGRASLIHSKVLSRADIGVSGDAVVSLTQMPMLVPRGRYEIDMFPNFMRLHGKTHDYKVPYVNITRLFKLPKPDQVVFVISLESPLRQGQTMYPHLVLQFPADERNALSVKVTPTPEMTDASGADLPETLSGMTVDVVAQAFKLMTGKRVTIPGSFKSFSGAQCIRCSFKANDGHLFFLERSIFFVHKPPVNVRYDQISLVEFTRANATTSKNFDVKIDKRDGSSFQFTNIQRNEYDSIRRFLKEKKMPIRTDRSAVSSSSGRGRGGDVDMASDHESEMEDSEEDEDFRVSDGESDIEEEFDENPADMDAAEGEEGGEGEGTPEKEKKQKQKQKSSSVSDTVKSEPSSKKAKIEENDAEIE